MKKLLLLAIVLSVFASSCQLSKTCYVRFENLTDFTLSYGVRFGDAMYLGVVAPGFLSGYYETEAGTYSLQALTVSGQWITISMGALSVSPDHYYTAVGTGTGGTYYWTIVQDS